MKIVICGSMTFSPEMMDVGNKLKEKGFEIVLPKFTEEYALLNSRDEMHKESAQNKVEHDLIKSYFEIIKDGDAVLVVNKDKKEVKNYVGGNSLLEMGFAHILGKKIFMLNPIPDMHYKDEIEAMEPVILNGGFENIK